jgi:hypothetical protein
MILLRRIRLLKVKMLKGNSDFSNRLSSWLRLAQMPEKSLGCASNIRFR